MRAECQDCAGTGKKRRTERLSALTSERIVVLTYCDACEGTGWIRAAAGYLPSPVREGTRDLERGQYRQRWVR